MEKYKNKYRIASARAQWWDYGWAGAYFITICTKNREHHFGEIVNGKMQLSHCGILADIFWHEIKNHAINAAETETGHAPSVQLGAFVVMPNHIHGILILNGNDIAIADNGIDNGNDIGNDNGNDNGIDNGNDNGIDRDGACPVCTTESPELESESPQLKSESESPRNIGKNSVSSIIGSYKSAVTKHANRLGLKNGWQTRFHDHIIRDDGEYQRINDYIENNIANWKEDSLNI